MTFESLVTNYGYLAVIIGTFFEGEMVLIIAGFLAHRGYMGLGWVIASAFTGSFLGDQLYFFIGRLKGRQFLLRRKTWLPKVRKVERFIESYSSPLIFGFRFIYGFRTVTPFAIGMSKVPTGKFILLNSLGAVSWAAVVATGGYLFGKALEAVVGDVKHYELATIGLVLLTSLVVMIIRRLKRKPPD